MMKLAHSILITPNRCGLYETTRELVAAERAIGIDARMVDPNPSGNTLTLVPGSEDRGAPVDPASFVDECDVIVSHSGIAGELDRQDKPVIFMAHGRPASSFIVERNGGTPVYSHYYRTKADPRYKAVVTFWPEHLPYLKVMWGSVPVMAIPPSVDLEAWKPGPKVYDFHGKGGEINVVVSDPWRDDIDPFTVVNAFALFARQFRSAKLHVYGAPKERRGFDALFKTLQDSGNLGEVCGWASGLVNVYRAADLVITPHRIYTRTIREAIATGCQVVSGRDCDPYDIERFAMTMAHRMVEPEPDVRARAERLFSPDRTARGMMQVLERLKIGQEAVLGY